MSFVLNWLSPSRKPLPSPPAAECTQTATLLSNTLTAPVAPIENEPGSIAEQSALSHKKQNQAEKEDEREGNAIASRPVKSCHVQSTSETCVSSDECPPAIPMDQEDELSQNKSRRGSAQHLSISTAALPNNGNITSVPNSSTSDAPSEASIASTASSTSSSCMQPQSSPKTLKGGERSATPPPESYTPSPTAAMRARSHSVTNLPSQLEQRNRWLARKAIKYQNQGLITRRNCCF